MSRTRILLLSDGRPGHFNLSEGIAAAVGRDGEVEINRLPVHRGKWPGPVTAFMTRSPMSSQQILKRVYRVETASLCKADLIVSAGGETLAANICIARHLNVPNIFYGSLRQYRASDFTLVLTSYPSQTRRAPNIIQTLKPSALDPDTLSQTNNHGMLGMLLGGPSGGIAFSDDDWKTLASVVEDTHASYGIRWVVSNSRRTPREGNVMLRKLAMRTDGPIAEFIDIESPTADTLSELFAKTNSVVCTADSSSMISEAVWARKPVIAVEPAKFFLTQNEQDYRSWLSHNRWAASVKISQLEAALLPQLLEEIRPLSHNPLDDLAKILREKLPLHESR